MPTSRSTRSRLSRAPQVRAPHCRSVCIVSIAIYKKDISPRYEEMSLTDRLFFEIQFFRNAVSVFDFDGDGVLHLVFEGFDFEMMFFFIR